MKIKGIKGFNLNPLNDVPATDALKIECMAKLRAAYDGSIGWPPEKQERVAGNIAVEIVREIIAGLPDLPVEIKEQCGNAGNLKDAYLAAITALKWEAVQMASLSAALSAEQAAALAAALSAADAVQAANAAAHARANSANAAKAMAVVVMGAADGAAWKVRKPEPRVEKIFRTACQIWLDAAR